MQCALKAGTLEITVAQRGRTCRSSGTRPDRGSSRAIFLFPQLCYRFPISKLHKSFLNYISRKDKIKIQGHIGPEFGICAHDPSKSSALQPPFSSGLLLQLRPEGGAVEPTFWEIPRVWH